MDKSDRSVPQCHSATPPELSRAGHAESRHRNHQGARNFRAMVHGGKSMKKPEGKPLLLDDILMSSEYVSMIF